MTDLDRIGIVEAAALMANVDVDDIFIDGLKGTLINYRIDAHPKANIRQEDLKEFRKAFKFLLSVATTLELKEIKPRHKSFCYELFITNSGNKEVYQEYLDRINKIETMPIEAKRVQYDFEDVKEEIPSFAIRHLHQFYEEKAMTMEELQRFQVLHFWAYRYLKMHFRTIHFIISEINTILQKYGYTDKYFNPALNNTGNSDPLIEWIGSAADFACMIALCREKKYINHKISDTESLRIAVKHFSGVNASIPSLMQMRRDRKKNSDWFDNANKLPEATLPKGKRKIK